MSRRDVDEEAPDVAASNGLEMIADRVDVPIMPEGNGRLGGRPRVSDELRELPPAALRSNAA